MLRKYFYALCTVGVLGASQAAVAEPLPFTEDNWAFIGGTMIEEKAGQQAVRLGVRENPDDFVGFGMVVAKTAPFLNGVLEYDLLFDATRSFGGLRFRTQSPGDFEKFNMRAHQSGNPDAINTCLNIMVSPRGSCITATNILARISIRMANGFM